MIDPPDNADRPQVSKWSLAMAYGVSGALLGGALAHPSLALCAWISVAVMAAALVRTRSSLAAAGFVLFAHMLTRVIAFPWTHTTNSLAFPYGEAGLIALTVTEEFIWTGPYALLLGLAHRMFGRWIAPRYWLPPAWALAEELRFWMVTISLDDWLNSQWTVTPVLEALAWIGWWPLLLACLFAAASLGEAAAARRWPSAVPGLGVLGVLWLAPPIPTDSSERLRGIAVVHTNSTVALPHALPPDVELVIWPETALELRPTLAEGPGNGAVIPPILRDDSARHVIGLLTRLPGRPLQNQVVAVDAEGRVIQSRAKSRMMPIAERRFLGLGDDRYDTGRSSPFFDVGELAIVPLICSEMQSRALASEGADAGGELMVIVASDKMFPDPRARDQLLAVQVLRAVEYRMPSVRASFDGRATIVGADGRVLARSSFVRNGLLTWDPIAGALDQDFLGREIVDEEPAPPGDAPDIAVIYARDAPQLRARCPEGRCSYHELESLECTGGRAGTVIVSGHGLPPDYLSRPAAEVAAAIRCFAPELVVIDTCFGASSELLSALGDLDAVVVASSTLLPPSGLVYPPEFFAHADAMTRARAIVAPGGGDLLRWRLDALALAELLRGVEAMSSDEVGARLARRRPPAIRVELVDGGPVLVPIAWERLGSRRPTPQRRPHARPGAR